MDAIKIYPEGTTLPAFEMTRTLVTQQFFEEQMGFNPSEFVYRLNPVESLTSREIKNFCQRIGYNWRLPSADEWGYAAQDLANLEDLDQFGVFRAKRTMPVGSKKPNKFGFFDLIGNVWDEVQSDDIRHRVLWGGSWLSYPRFLGTAHRYRHSADYRDSRLGFRLARTLP